MIDSALPRPVVAWFLAARPKTLTASLAPIVVGSILAYIAQGEILWGLTFCALFSAMFIQIGTNLINDALDYTKGTDTNERLGPRRATQSGWLSPQQVLAAGLACLAMAMVGGLPLVFNSGLSLMLLLLVSSVLAYLYTGGPYPLAYHGLGDIFVFLFFGLISTSAIYYIQTGTVSGESLMAGSQVGLLATVMIAINNFRDVAEDQQSNKRTLAVRFGATFARWEIGTCIILPFTLNVFWAAQGMFYATLLPLLLLPFALKIVVDISRYEPSQRFNQYLGLAAALHLLFSMLLAMGLALDHA